MTNDVLTKVFNSFNSNAITTNATASTITSSYPWPHDNFQTAIYQPFYTYWHSTPSKTEQAFKVIQKLMEMKLIEVRSVPKFVEAINKIAEAL
jgi:hypothetical protein